MQLLEQLNINKDMTPLEKTIVAIGAIDLLYIAWVILGAVLHIPGSLPDIWASLNASESQSPELMFSVILLFNLSIALCGFGLLTRSTNFILLNYLHLPFRVLMGVPTLFPLFGLISLLDITLSATALLASLLFMEAFRVALVMKWKKTLG